MTLLKYEWLKNKNITIEDNEHFLFIKYKGIPKSVYSSTNKILTEDFLKKEVNKLEKSLR